ncbi:hypothetical protein [Desulfonatronum lacustre]|uniref:hypothetical protein n=1 Tax=Desulfonatronum lacustre TaxID=66849 RepID=UPI00049120E3|nr:hypothetical protein [Desulfonatronum lacustre]
MDIYAITEAEGRGILDGQGVADLLQEGADTEIKPKWDDLARLYMLVRERKPFHILEFGSGFSTIVMASALKQNWEECRDILARQSGSQAVRQILYERPQMVSIESSKKWMLNTREKVEKGGLAEFTDIVFSNVSIAEYQGQVCHFYDELPDVVPDFVYMDGPDPSTVKGSINGISFKRSKRTVMSGDILKYESTLLPSFFMIVDGRTNNARFLQRMLLRKYDVIYHKKADVTTFQLKEPRLGIKNVFGWEAYSDLLKKNNP